MCKVDVVLSRKMFNFMKKDKDKEDDRKKKKEKKRSKERAGMTKEELWRLDEARRSLIGKSKKKKEEKLPSGITADYMDQFRSGLQQQYDDDPEIAAANTFHEIRERYEALASAQSLHSDSSSDGVSLRSSGGYSSGMTPKRGILKGQTGTEYQGVRGNIDDDRTLLQNTNYNETYENLVQQQLERAESQSSMQDRLSLSSTNRISNGSLTSPRSPLSPTQLSPVGAGRSLTASASTNLFVPQGGPAPSEIPPPLPVSLPPFQQQQMLQSAYKNMFFNGVPPGESAGLNHHYTKTFKAKLCLPALIPYQAPPPRTLSIERLPAGDFGFSLRRCLVLERVPGKPDTKRTIIFAEPGTVGRANNTGLLPGDRLMKVNGISVEDNSREEIIELIKASSESVTLEVSQNIFF